MTSYTYVRIVSKYLYIVHSEFRGRNTEGITLDVPNTLSVYISSSTFSNFGIDLDSMFNRPGLLLYVANCDFNGNQVGISIGDSSGNKAAKVFFANNTFTNISTKYNTIIVDLASNYIKMDNCSFINNYECKAVIYALTNELYLVKCKFIDNDCSRTTVEVFPNDLLLINDSIFVNNHGTWGGGITINADFHTLVFIKNCTFTLITPGGVI